MIFRSFKKVLSMFRKPPLAIIQGNWAHVVDPKNCKTARSGTALHASYDLGKLKIVAVEKEYKRILQCETVGFVEFENGIPPLLRGGFQEI